MNEKMVTRILLLVCLVISLGSVLYSTHLHTQSLKNNNEVLDQVNTLASATVSIFEIHAAIQDMSLVAIAGNYDMIQRYCLELEDKDLLQTKLQSIHIGGEEKK